MHVLEEQLALARQDLVASQAELARREVELAASETNRQQLQERLRSITPQSWRQPPPRWSWPRWILGVLVGVAALSALLGSVGGTQARLAPSLPPLMVPAPAAASVADRAADAEWPALLRALDTAWEQDWPGTIATLERFLAHWPGHAAGQDKLYAALVADSQVHLQTGQVDEGVVELERAARLLPERPEAWALLAQLATLAQP
jgi:predicted Zn-dependent protease